MVEHIGHMMMAEEMALSKFVRMKVLLLDFEIKKIRLNYIVFYIN